MPGSACSGGFWVGGAVLDLGVGTLIGVPIPVLSLQRVTAVTDFLTNYLGARLLLTSMGSRYFCLCGIFPP